jgi:secretion/DNA translocation related CpaE-like protein
VALHGAQVGFRSHTLLVDGDHQGGGLDLLMGIEQKPGLRWPALVLDHGRVAASALHSALPEAGPGLSVLACRAHDGHGLPGPFTTASTAGEVAGPSPAAVTAVLHAGRDGGDLVVCDVPRERTATAEAMLDAADLVAVVVPADLRSTLAARSLTNWLLERNTHCGLVVRGPAPGGLTAGSLAAAVALPVLTTMRAQPRLAEQVEQGGLRLTGHRTPLWRAAGHVLARLGDMPDRPGPAVVAARPGPTAGANPLEACA